MRDFRLAIRGDLAKAFELEAKAGAQAATTVIRRRTTRLKTSIRRQIASVGLGERLGKTIRDAVYPNRGASLSAKGIIRSSAIYKRPGGLVDLITVFEEGATINARGGRYLAIPLGAGKTESLSKFDNRSIALLPLRSGKGYLVIRRDTSQYRRRSGSGFWGEPLFLLIPQATIRKRLDLDSEIARATNGIEQELVNEWNRRTARAGIAGE